MTYATIDELNHFTFHDAELKKIDFRDSSMFWQLSCINATTLNTQNNFDVDMCITEAEIIFEQVNIEKIVFGAYKVYSSDNVLINSVEEKTASPDEYKDILEKTLGGYCYIFSMEILPEHHDKSHVVCFNIDGGAGSYYLTISFMKSIVQWNEYSGEAWYEDEKWKKK